MKMTNQTNLTATAPTTAARPNHFAKCKFCFEKFNLNEEGNTYRDGTAAHEDCADNDDWLRENAADMRA